MLRIVGVILIAVLGQCMAAVAQTEPAADPPQTAPAETQPATQPAPPPPPPPPPPVVAEAPPPPAEIVPREVLIIGRIGQFGRTMLHTDAIEAQIVAGTYKPPVAGEAVTLPDGSTQTWTALAIGEDGWFRHELLSGGYARFAVPADRSRVMLLQMRGNTSAYVNGELRVGDPYNMGYTEVPVLLREGANEFLFHCRGQLWAKLVQPHATVKFNRADLTLPDLVVGIPVDAWAGVVVMNATTQMMTGLSITAAQPGGAITATDIPALPPLCIRKVPFRIQGQPVTEPGPKNIRLDLHHQIEGRDEVLDSHEFALSVVKPEDLQKRTFISEIDGSVQYYALRPAHPVTADAPPPGLLLSLHGASVEAVAQAAAYQPKPWLHIVAPTNRRPFGFDWEDWGRLDAMEVLEIAQRELKPDPLRTYLSGHSMGGHGTWHIGATFPDRFAAIAPSAGWISFWSYAGAARFENATPLQELLLRATAPSDTLTLSRNYLHHGIYILHGDGDDNVPVEQARIMRKHLAEYHPDFAYYERPGAGHWWGDACVDWPPLIGFLQDHTIPATAEAHHVQFTTASPGVSANCRWATMETQFKLLKPSSINLRRDLNARTIAGTTENVSMLSLDVSAFPPGSPIILELDGQKFDQIALPPPGERLWLARASEQWSPAAKPALSAKGPHRYGPFKDAFRHRMVFVYGTSGTPEENTWSFNKARFDAETFWYRGNGSIDVIADREFDPVTFADRSVILYGHSESNAAWSLLLADSPVQVRRGSIKVGDRELAGEDLACLFLRPRPASDIACVGVVAGSGLVGLRLTDRLPFFISGVGFPDCVVIGAEALAKADAGVRGLGFFGTDWRVESGEFIWRE